jgi:hypothetical protein
VNRRAVAQPGALRQLQALNSGRNNTETKPVVHEHNHSYSFNIQTADARDFERVVYDKIIPALQEAQRRGVYDPTRK